MKKITLKEYFVKRRIRIGLAACGMMLAGRSLGFAPDQSLRPAPTPSIALRQAVPPKIFTPNGDGINDLFTLVVDNPAGNVLSQKKIYDLQGFEVADMEVIGDETAATAIFRWNGKDKDGSTAPSGIYIYQLQSEGQSINGTVVIAR